MATCPHCDRDDDDCTYWEDTAMGWVCGTTGELTPDLPRGLCEVCDEPFTAADLEDGVTLSADCCDRTGLCIECREKGNHDCDTE